MYDPKAKDNEEQSADLFKDFAREINLPPEETDHIAKWILFTKSHAIAADYEAECSADFLNDLKLFLDLDLSIFVVSPEEYDVYCDEIRREYIHFQDADFFRGRSAVMSHFLQRSPIYKTAHFQALEHVARSNISREIEELNNKARSLS